MSAHACQELYFGGSVGFVGFEVEEDADQGYRDEFEEVQCEQVRLRAIGLPVVGEVWTAQGCYAGAGFGGRYCPGSQRRDLFEAGWWEWDRVLRFVI